MSNHQVEELVQSYRERNNIATHGGGVEREVDRYEVVGSEFTSVTHEEYVNANKKQVSFSFTDFLGIQERSTLNPSLPLVHYEHDPIVLVNALMIGCNIEMNAKLAASIMSYKNLNKETIHQVTEEYLYALMAINAATRTKSSVKK
jgi:hypothetical protein